MQLASSYAAVQSLPLEMVYYFFVETIQRENFKLYLMVSQYLNCQASGQRGVSQ